MEKEEKRKLIEEANAEKLRHEMLVAAMVDKPLEEEKIDFQREEEKEKEISAQLDKVKVVIGEFGPEEDLVMKP